MLVSQDLLLYGLLASTNFGLTTASAIKRPRSATTTRERTSINADWRFERFVDAPDSLSYETLRPWILPSANNFLNGDKYEAPGEEAPGSDVEFIQPDFDDQGWEQLDLPHDWAITGTFDAPGVEGGLGRLPINGVGWYRKTLSLEDELIASGKSIFLDVDGAMSYAAVWLNGKFVGGWPFGYNSFRLDLTPFAKSGENQLVIRLENLLDSSRWYPGAGIYRNVWLVTASPVHVAHFGTYVTTPSVSADEATVDVAIEIENAGNSTSQVEIETKIYELDPTSRKPTGDSLATVKSTRVAVEGKSKQAVNGSTTVANPKLWGPPPSQKPNEYIAVSTLSINGTEVDSYETPFGIRTVQYDPLKGILLNGEPVRVYGTCNHHDLGSLGAAFNYRAAERQIQMLQDMGNNALRTSHNPPAPEFLDIADRLGLMVQDEIFDTWSFPKVKNDFHRIFKEWHEPDLRSFIRRDRNHPSIIAWSIGNEIPEQANSTGGETGKILQDIAHAEDPTRQVTNGLNTAKPGSPFTDVIDIIGLNYQGEGKGNSWVSTFPDFQKAYPNKMIWSTESASTVASRGIYIFPVHSNISTIVGAGPGEGADPETQQVSAYGLYAPPWAASQDKVFEQQDKHPYVAGEFVWTGWDYIGEPTPYDNSSRSSYFGIIDLAGFPKERYYLYQSRWRPELAQAKLIPHWTWPDRVGKVTPVHVFTSGDEAELFVNDVSAGRKKKGQYDYRLRWDNVTYSPGSIRVVAYKDGKEWASDSHVTVSEATALNVTADRTTIRGDGQDLSFITVAVVDKDGNTIPQGDNEITFSVSSGPGKIISTDNGDATDMVPFPSHSRKAFSGLALAIVKAEAGSQGEIVIEAKADGLTAGKVVLTAS
ncbi:glycoside hydrolase family 2 protein [Aaosphaeria arxii CBS 175.79]|uniref:Glycoside hydrolase family 2 protein n=1 Tax=Aaosphaeria arxii CBS 175.79 TaxID=1450172 RepID=A0A6A5X9Q5_9PLEO|nr:glycoside hydrolase family 2 protein [Aaosphaeria arxii CBS 175.79]KAF2009698.1 glycoside hydrolase family 2 protein [Aaosphaeria arxii CBS 175.79]